MVANHAIIARDKDFDNEGHALIRGTKEYCKAYLAKQRARRGWMQDYLRQPARWLVQVEDITDKPHFAIGVDDNSTMPSY